MILATDVHYRDDGSAMAAGLLFADWDSAEVAQRETLRIDTVRPYVPGRFYERELPCLMALLTRFAPRPDIIVIDGYVTLGAEGRDGLGAHLYRELGGSAAVIGVAKTRFAGTPEVAEVLRGSSKHPLYVTSIGVPAALARRHIEHMHGPYRIPTLLAQVDRLCRDG